jgi:hypothetical protein
LNKTLAFNSILIKNLWGREYEMMEDQNGKRLVENSKFIY